MPFGTYLYSSPAPATQETVQARNAGIIGSVVTGTVSVIQALKQPTTFYNPALAGTYTGGSQGAAQGAEHPFSLPLWGWLGLAAIAGLGIFVVYRTA